MIEWHTINVVKGRICKIGFCVSVKERVSNLVRERVEPGGIEGGIEGEREKERERGRERETGGERQRE